ncbi:MAG: chemotaxis protein CheB [Myxococcota bacterium]|nr:chemotaxis protein CheB [Myxococcota bacterium]
MNDSPVACAIIRAILEADGGYKIVGEAPTGRDAVRIMDALRPDIVLMDIHMPEMNGVEATKRIMANHKTSVLVTSATINRNLSYIFEAQAAGAIDFIHTPTLLRRPGSRVSDAELKRAGRTLLYKLRGIQKMRQRKQESIEAKLPSKRAIAAEHIDMPHLPKRPSPAMGKPLIAIGASTGGPSAIVELLSGITNPCPVPILVVLHIDQHFSQGFALWLEDQTGFQANLVDRVTQIRPGEIYVAPGGERNMIFTSAGAVRLEPSAKDEIHVPNIDALLNSLARYQAAATCSVVLTGMGRDGAKGSLAIHQGGGTALAQAPETATIASMPQAVLDEGASVRGLPIPTLSAYLNTWARHMSR